MNGTLVSQFVALYNDTTDEDSESLKRLSYDKFLETDYWKIIAAYVRQRDNFKCRECGSDKSLQVHHLTYENHGYEHRTQEDDLITVCDKCHKNIHRIESKLPQIVRLKHKKKKSKHPLRPVSDSAWDREGIRIIHELIQIDERKHLLEKGYRNRLLGRRPVISQIYECAARLGVSIKLRIIE